MRVAANQIHVDTSVECKRNHSNVPVLIVTDVYLCATLFRMYVKDKAAEKNTNQNADDTGVRPVSSTLDKYLR